LCKLVMVRGARMRAASFVNAALQATKFRALPPVARTKNRPRESSIAHG
jgi:hypothetical protein